MKDNIDVIEKGFKKSVGGPSCSKGREGSEWQEVWVDYSSCPNTLVNPLANKKKLY